MATNVTFADKSQTEAYDAAKINAQDINDLKAACNLFGIAGDIVALTDSSTGTSGGNTIAAVTNPTFGWNGSTDPTATEGTAINAALTALKNAVATNAAKLNAILAALKAAGLMA